MEAILGTDIIASLNVHNLVTLGLEPRLNNDNILQSAMGGKLYRIITGVKDKVKMNHLSKPNNGLQPRTNCKDWSPSLSVAFRSTELTVCSFELMAEQCEDDFNAGCLRNLEAVGNNMIDMGASAQLSEIQAAAVMLTMETITDDIYEIAWFGDTEFSDANDQWHSDLSQMDVADAEHLKKKIRHCEGWWKEIVERTAETAPLEKVRYVDSNDGTAGGNATNPANVTTFMQTMINQSSSKLRTWAKARPMAERPVFLLQSEIYQAYITYLTSLGNDEAFRLLVNGTPVEGVYTFKGYPVMEVSEWSIFDEKIGAGGKNQRALFIAQENLVIGIDADSVAGYQGQGLVVQKSPLVKDKGMYYMYTALKLGARIAYPELVTASWNSSTVFI